MKKTSDELLQKAVDLYKEGFGSYTIAKMIGVSKPVILQHLKLSNIERRDNANGESSRIYKLNVDGFNKIDSEISAYLLGFMYADGYNNQKDGCIQIGISSKDVEVLEIFKEYLKSTHPIKINKRSLINENWQDSATLCIWNKNISKNLAELGCYQGKSLTLQFPTEQQVPKDYLHHFVRGYFDGDGYVEKKGKRADFWGTEDFLNALKVILETDAGLINIPKFGIRFPERNNTTRCMWLQGIHKSIPLYNYMYRDSNYCLTRKKERFLISVNNQIISHEKTKA
jgi:intein-encoded DNA endonuclease-like protein